MKSFQILLLSLVSISTAWGAAISPGSYYVTTDTLNVRLAPNPSGKVTNRLYKRQKVDVVEIKKGWARVSKYYSGQKEGLEGNVARWVAAKYLSKNKPKDIKSTTPLENVLKSSDNYSKYKKTFIKSSNLLITQGKCKLSDFKEMGGWVRSSSYKTKPVFFTYCGGMKSINKIYLNANTGKAFK